MTTLLHLSDPHFGTERPQVVEALLRCVAPLAVDVVVISGDITQRARRSQFHRAQAFVERLRQAAPGAPVLLTPGNHDIPLFDLPLRLLDPYRNFRRAFGEELEPRWEDAGVHIQVLNTIDPWRHTDGIVRPAQIERVAERLARARPEQLRVVVTHQPAAVIGKTDRHNLLRNHRQALRRWAQAGADLVLGGHIHLPYLCHVAPDGADGRHIHVVQAGTAVSRRLRHEAGNSFNLVHYIAAAHDCTVERWDYVEQEDCFHCCSRTPLTLQR